MDEGRQGQEAEKDDLDFLHDIHFLDQSNTPAFPSETPPCPGRVSRQGLAKLNLETKCQGLLHYLNASLK